jgi:uncharacterized protein (DUF1501 family)
MASRPGCREWTRADLLRQGAARAGAGLPAIEPGMPAPAGTGLSRRSFVARSGGLALAVYGAGHLKFGGFEDGIAQAAAGPSAPILISIFLDGGIDSLSVVGPVSDGAYQKLRPKLRIHEGAGKPWADGWQFAKEANGLAQLHSEGKLTLMPAVGYTNADQSHFTSRHYWEVGATDTGLRTGWLGRYLDRHGSADNPLQGLALSSTLLPVLATGGSPVAAVPSATDFGFWTPGVWGEVQERMLDTIAELAAAAPSDAAGRQYARAAQHTHRVRQQLQDFPKVAPPVAYPSDKQDFPKRMAELAAMIGLGMPLRCVALSYGSFDTHDEQAAKLPEQLTMLSDTLLAFQRDLEARGQADRVLVQVWSEFGRRPEENGSGTDHGAAGMGMLIGSRLNGRPIGEPPSLTRLDDHGNLRATSDFRAVYAALLEQWMGVDATPIIPGAARLRRPDLLR